MYRGKSTNLLPIALNKVILGILEKGLKSSTFAGSTVGFTGFSTCFRAKDRQSDKTFENFYTNIPLNIQLNMFQDKGKTRSKCMLCLHSRSPHPHQRLPGWSTCTPAAAVAQKTQSLFSPSCLSLCPAVSSRIDGNIAPLYSYSPYFSPGSALTNDYPALTSLRWLLVLAGVRLV